MIRALSLKKLLLRQFDNYSGLKSDRLLGARLFAVIDTLDAMTSDRPYRKGSSYDTAKAEILKLSGTQFDPMAVQAFIAEEVILREMAALKCSLPLEKFYGL